MQDTRISGYQDKTKDAGNFGVVKEYSSGKIVTTDFHGLTLIFNNKKYYKVKSNPNSFKNFAAASDRDAARNQKVKQQLTDKRASRGQYTV